MHSRTLTEVPNPPLRLVGAAPQAVKRRMAAPSPRAEATATTVGIVGSAALTRMGLRGIVEYCAGTRLVGEAQDAPTMIELVHRHRPAVLIVDVGDSADEMLSAIAVLRARIPATHVIVLAANPADDLVFQALSAGATGVLLKDCDPQELAGAVRAVAAGGAALSSPVTRRLVSWFLGNDVEAARKAHDLIGGLSGRESEVLALVADGMANQEIARRLYMSAGSVKAHISNLLIKLGCTNRVQAAMTYHFARLPH